MYNSHITSSCGRRKRYAAGHWREIHMKTMKKLWLMVAALSVTTLLCVISASACTMVYVGSDYTADGSTFMARSEDYSNSYNKIAYVSQHGKHAAGSVYEGCYGLTHTFTHDSYAYTAVSDDNTSGVCPDCDGTHAHTPMEECGTNEKGVSVSAMVTLNANSAVRKADPMVSGGMCESDMATILLSEASTAKEGVDLLLNIYNTVGAEERSGVLIGDQNEVWYVENYTGTQYIAVKLSSSMIAINPNMGAIGLVSLNDTENVIASDKLIEVAQQAETFVGDAEANTIDVYQSYCGYATRTPNARLLGGVNYFLNDSTYTADTLKAEDFTISNVKDGKIVTLYTNIQNNLGAVDAQTMVDFYKVDGIGNTGNLEWHIFQISPNGAMETSTIEWLAMEHGQYTVAIPYFPVLTTDVYEGYQFGGESATFTTEKPDSLYGAYPTTKRGVAGYLVLPEGWENGYYWTVDALSNYAISDLCSDADREMIHKQLAVMQQLCYDKAAEMQKAIAGMSTDAAKEYATAQSAALAKQAHELTLQLYKHVVTGEHVYGDWEVTTPSTCLTEGTETQTCQFCDATQTKSLPLGDHSWDEGVVTIEPTTAAEGIKTYTCTVCGQTRTETIPATGASTCTGGPSCPSYGLHDVAGPDYWAHKGIDYCVRNRLMNGVGAGTFSPSTACTRAQIVKILYNRSGNQTDYSYYYLPFTDVAPGAWYYNAVAWAYYNDVTSGTSATMFTPNAAITRQQLVTFLYRYTVKYAPEFTGNASPISAFPDAGSVANWAYAAMSWAVGNGLIKGNAHDNGPDYLDPNGSATRAQCAAMLVRFQDKFEAPAA
mgnify:CR=1 FL=1